MEKETDEFSEKNTSFYEDFDGNADDGADE